MLKALNIKKNIENICFRITILLIHRTAETLGLKSVTWQHTSNITTDTVINYGPLGSFHSQAGEHKVWGGGCDNIVLTTTIITHHFLFNWFWPPVYWLVLAHFNLCAHYDNKHTQGLWSCCQDLGRLSAKHRHAWSADFSVNDCWPCLRLTWSTSTCVTCIDLYLGNQYLPVYRLTEVWWSYQRPVYKLTLSTTDQSIDW